MTKIATKLPEFIKRPIRRVMEIVRAISYGSTRRFCPVCEKSARKFRPYGVKPRKDAECPHCGTLERHRLLWKFLQEKTHFFDGAPKKMLHVAPESCFESRFRQILKNNYLTADLVLPSAMVKMDVTDIQYPDQSFDIIYCSHVLEHVHDDRLAMREFFRVLRQDGWAILLVPIYSEKTFEDPSVTDPRERLKVFGQEDHVRRYGPDYVDRLRDAGFVVDIIKVSDLAGPSEAERMGLTAASGDIFFCTKRSGITA